MKDFKYVVSFPAKVIKKCGLEEESLNKKM